MAVHKLILDDAFDEVVFTLIGMHCTLEDYRLAYLLNKYLGITLSRKSSDIDYGKAGATYSIYEWEDEKQLLTWSMVSNISKTQVQQKKNYVSLFDSQQHITKISHLLPEYKTVNYFLKIDFEFSLSKEKYILDKILSIPQIATAYSIDSSKLKSKDNLIFS